ncbi:MAG: DDE-type integrase/transposase/recombinase [Candidatus Woesearchaeota archaeon]
MTQQLKKKKSVKDIALAQKINRSTVWKIKKKYEQYGGDGLKDHKSGRLFELVNPKFYELVVKEWKRNKCGARKLYMILEKKGFGVSLRKISQVMVNEGFQKPVPKRKKLRKYKRYEWPIPNYMWHTDWHVIKAERLKGENILVYIDDCSRKIMGYILGSQTTQNSLFALYDALAKHGVTPFCLNSDRGSQFIANKFDKDGNANHAFQQALEELGILFIPSKKRHPQTNGKNERFFGILDQEFDERFKDIDEFIKWYNNERLSEAVDYMTPSEAYKKRL